MTGRCIAVNLGPPSPITLMPPMQLLNLLPPPPVLPPAAAVPHRPLTPKVSAQSTSLSTSSHFYTTPRHTPSPSSPPSTIPATTVSSLLTRVQQTTCSRTRVHSFRTGLSPVAASAWATTPLPPSWARDWQSSQSMDGSSWFGTVSTFRPSAIHSTASVLINVRMVVVLSGCTALACTSSFPHSSSKLTPPPTATCRMPPLDVLPICLHWTTSNQSHTPLPRPPPPPPLLPPQL